MGLPVALGLLALFGIALALTVRKTRFAGLMVFLISVVVLVAGGLPGFLR